MIKRVFYCSSAGDIIQSHQCWKRGANNPAEVSITFSGQIAEFCRDIGAKAYFVSANPHKAKLTDEDFTLEHRPKPVRHGARFHIGEIIYGIGLLRTALSFRAQVALIDSGSTHFFLLALFRIFGITVVPILHNTLWATGFPPTKPVARALLQLDRLFWQWIPATVIAVSPECVRQLDSIRGKKRYPIHQVRAQFYPDYFARIPPPPPHEQRPFQVMFIGRVNRSKGVFDILEIARHLEDSHPGLVRWEICGRGSDFDQLVARHGELDLVGVVNLRGWTTLEDLIGVYAKSHASIVPTRSTFAEGLAMTAAESILAGRPVITNPVVPALEVLRYSCVEAKTNDVESHLRAVLKLATDADLYHRARDASVGYQPQFYDRNNGFAEVLKRALASQIAAGNL